MSVWSQAPTLRGEHVTLEPLAAGHAEALAEAVRDGELWKAWYGSVPAPEAMRDYVAAALAMRDAGTALPWVARDRRGEIVGTTRFYDVAEKVPRVSIGYTWYAARVQRTGLNTEAKLLLLAHAFETLGCIAVALKTSWFNHASRAAIARLGARQDGVLRNHMRHNDGSVRDSVVFSIIDAEWPAVRSNLRAKLESHRHG
ncbi:GNAT family N-acetyltransferase [Luteimonas aquatica]|uniref:GNAT family N-acetyltransferase n=1 Tax=Luteimonas aquatica TaxID=450364 RepID=UPI001F5A58A5|nr:GNAT family protein [Luteimonas aquatica]